MAINHINDTLGSIQQPKLTLPTTQNLQTSNHRTENSSQTNLSPNQETEAHINQAIEKMQETVSNLAQNLQFSIDEDTGKTVVKVMDAQTQEIIRQIPSKEAISIARTLDKVQGLLLNDQA